MICSLSLRREDRWLVLALNLVISSYNLRVAWWRARLVTSCSYTRPLGKTNLSFRRRRRRRTVASLSGRRRWRGAIGSLALGAISWSTRLASNIVVCYPAIFPSTMPSSFRVWNGLVIVVALGVLCNDVPGVQEAG
jgi:hypothetical protein